MDRGAPGVGMLVYAYYLALGGTRQQLFLRNPTCAIRTCFLTEHLFLPTTSSLWSTPGTTGPPPGAAI